MVTYADYKYYVEEFHGTMPEDSFIRFSVKANAYLRQVTFNRITEPLIEEVKECSCALIELLYDDSKRDGKVSENTDGYSVSYKVEDIKVKMNETCRMYLSTTKLLNVGCYE